MDFKVIVFSTAYTKSNSEEEKENLATLGDVGRPAGGCYLNLCQPVTKSSGLRTRGRNPFLKATGILA